MLWNLVLEKTLESPLDCKEIQLVHPKGDQSWLFIGSTDVEAETPIFWPTWCEELTHLKRCWYWERLQAGGEGDDRGWDGLMVSPTPELAQTHVHWVNDAIQPSHPLSSPSPPACNLSQHQDLFKWVRSSHQVAKLLEFQLHYQSFQWIVRTDFL